MWCLCLPWVIDLAKFCAIADEVGALLMADIADISGLVASKQHPAPFEHGDALYPHELTQLRWVISQAATGSFTAPQEAR